MSKHGWFLKPLGNAETQATGPGQIIDRRIEVEANPGIDIICDGLEGFFALLISHLLQIGQVCVVVETVGPS